MHPMEVIFPSVVVVILAMVYQGNAIMCYECNSKYDPRCGDPFDDFSVGLVDCDQKQHSVTHLHLEGEEPTRATICRKTVQAVENDTRVIRACGWIENPGYLKDRSCFQRAGTHQVQVYHCACDEDNCNGASGISFTLFFLPFLTLLRMFQSGAIL